MQINPARVLSWLDWLYITYLGLLPSAALAALIARYGGQANMGSFLLGTAGVGVYLAVVISYRPRPRSILHGVWLLLDGPVWALTAWLLFGQTGAVFIETGLIEAAVVFSAIFVLAGHSALPTPVQRVSSLLLMAALLGGTVWLFWPYITDQLWGNWPRLFWLTAGAFQGGMAVYQAMRKERLVQRNEFILLFFLAIFLAVLLIGGGSS